MSATLWLSFGRSGRQIVALSCTQLHSTGHDRWRVVDGGSGGGKGFVVSGLTLCMIVRNEQSRLPVCLASVAEVVDELVVVDTGSTDATPDIAREHGATLIRHRMDPVDFAAARNRGLARATGDMILVLDADETLAPVCLPEIRRLVAAADDVGWIASRRNRPEGATAPAWVDHVVRLFPNRSAYRFRSRVHETVDRSILAGGGRLQRSMITIDHHLPPQEALRTKWRRYVGLLRDELAQNPDDTERLVFLMADYYKLEQFAEATAVASQIAELCPQDFTAQFHAALCAFVDGRDLGRASSYLTAALAIRPEDPEALLLAGMLRGAKAPAPVAGPVPGR